MLTQAVDKPSWTSAVEGGWWQGQYALGYAGWHRSLVTPVSGLGVNSTLTAESFAALYESWYDDEPTEQAAAQYAAGLVLVSAIEAADTLETNAVTAQLRALELGTMYGKVSFRSEEGMNAMPPCIIQTPPAVSQPHTVYPPESATPNASIYFPTPAWAVRRCRADAKICDPSGGTCNRLGECECFDGFAGTACLEEAHEGFNTLWLIVTLGSVVGCAALIACAWGARHIYRQVQDAKKAKREKEIAKQLRVMKCVDMMTDLCALAPCASPLSRPAHPRTALTIACSRRYHPVVFVNYANFRVLGSFRPHEELLANNLLWISHTYPQLERFIAKHPTVFFSHQWLGFNEPDPEGLHFQTVCNACEFLLERDGLAADELFVWVDYSSIPQACKYTQLLSISSLAVYASHVRYFVIVAPETKHHDKKTPCNLASYSRRGWCRLEQWARMSASGHNDLFKWSGTELELAFDDEHEKEDMVASLMVCEGDFAVPKDVPKLVDTILGLWALCVARKHLDETIAEVEGKVRENKERVFPPKILGSEDLGFSDLPERLEQLLKEKPELCKQLRGERGSSSDDSPKRNESVAKQTGGLHNAPDDDNCAQAISSTGAPLVEASAQDELDFEKAKQLAVQRGGTMRAVHDAVALGATRAASAQHEVEMTMAGAAEQVMVKVTKV